MLSEVLLLAAGALMGSTLSFVFFYRWEKKKTSAKITNTQKIINDEFYLIHLYAKKCRGQLDRFKKNQNGSFDEMIEKAFRDVSRGRPLVQNLRFYRSFLFWNSIISSGSLINLPSSDIVLVNSFHTYVENIFSFLKEGHAALKVHLREAALRDDRQSAKEYCVKYMARVDGQFWKLTIEFDRLCESLTWMKPDYSDPSLPDTIAKYSRPVEFDSLFPPREDSKN